MEVVAGAYRVTPLLLIPAKTGCVGSGAQSGHPVVSSNGPPPLLGPAFRLGSAVDTGAAPPFGAELALIGVWTVLAGVACWVVPPHAADSRRTAPIVAVVAVVRRWVFTQLPLRISWPAR